MSSSIFEVSEYFYPFSIEFSILIVGIWYIIWNNVGNVEELKDEFEFIPGLGTSELSKRPDGHSDALIMHTDFSNSTRGLGLGIILLVFALIAAITMIVLKTDCTMEASILHFGLISESAVLVIMIVACLATYNKIVMLDINYHSIS